MNLREIIESTRDYNFHSHTQFCDGREPMERMVEAALECGVKHYGFTPHSPIPYASNCNMLSSDVNNYREEFLRLKRKYEGRIHLYMSMEIDYFGDQWGATNPYFSTIPLDYRLSSIHFIPTPDGSEYIDVDGRPENFARKMHDYFDNDIRYVVDTFYAHTVDMIERGGFDILGHFDKIGFNASSFSPGIESEAWYRRHIDDIIDLILTKDIIVEVNTKAWLPAVGSSAADASVYVPRLFPSPDVIRRLVSAGVTLAVNSDAHYPSRIAAGRDAAFAIIDDARS